VGGARLTGTGGIEAALVEAALEIGRSLASAAEPSGDGLTWHADIVVGIDQAEPIVGYGEVGQTLYDGTAGIALALAACAAVASPVERPMLAEAARGAACHAASGAQDLLEAGRLGLFEGATGVALGAATAGRTLGDAALVERATALANSVAARVAAPPRPADDPELDLIGGLAGTLLGLQSTIRVVGGTLPPSALSTAGRRLAAAATPQTWGAAWQTEAAAAGGPPLLGLGHGAAGIALALAEIAAVNDDADLRQASAGGFEYERGWFDPDFVGWPDLRNVDAAGEPTGWMTAWCHGALGIGLSRLRLARLTAEPLAIAEASSALQAARHLVVSAGTALHGGHTSDCSACHGLAGVVELLIVAAEALGVPDHRRAARRAAGLLLEQRDTADGVWPCGLPGAGEVPGLMLGTAGIALTLLRAAGAVEVPTPLLPGPAGW
jgi:lantibiotic modifying enzyme